MIAAFFLASAALAADPAPPLASSLDELREAYESAAPAGQHQAASRYGEALLEVWASAKEDAAAEAWNDFQALKVDLEGPPLSERQSKARTALATSALPLLVEGRIEGEQAAKLAPAVQPTRGHRVTDSLAEKGELAEPYGWDVQAVYALALARAGQIDAARKESDLLLKKVSIAIEKGRPFPTEFFGRTRSFEQVRREALLQRALIEAIAGDDAAVAKRSSQAGPPDGETSAQETAREERLIAAIARALEKSE